MEAVSGLGLRASALKFGAFSGFGVRGFGLQVPKIMESCGKHQGFKSDSVKSYLPVLTSSTTRAASISPVPLRGPPGSSGLGLKPGLEIDLWSEALLLLVLGVLAQGSEFCSLGSGI